MPVTAQLKTKDSVVLDRLTVNVADAAPPSVITVSRAEIVTTGKSDVGAAGERPGSDDTGNGFASAARATTAGKVATITAALADRPTIRIKRCRAFMGMWSGQMENFLQRHGIWRVRGSVGNT